MQWLTLIQITTGILIVILVLMQSEGGGLGSTFGGLATYHTKRGIEKSLFITTIFLVVVFTLASILVLFQ